MLLYVCFTEDLASAEKRCFCRATGADFLPPLDEVAGAQRGVCAGLSTASSSFSSEAVPPFVFW